MQIYNENSLSFKQDVLREILELNQDVNILCTEKKKLPSNEEIKIIIIINVSRGSILPLLLGPFWGGKSGFKHCKWKKKVASVWQMA